MAELPDGFDPFEHLQQTYKTEFNRRVDRYFKDVEGNGDLSRPPPSLKLACRIIDNDNDAMMNMRHNLFFNVIGYSRKNLAVVYGSKFDTAPPVAGHPQLFLYFSQDGAAQPTDEPLIEHEKSCRLMNFSCSSDGIKPAITKADMTAIANEIKILFLDAKKGITYTCGNKSASYTDPDNGFPKGNYLLVNSKADAENIYSKICNVIDAPFKGASHIVVNDPDKPSTTATTAGKTTILGKPKNNRRYRPVAVLRFRYAYISLGNLIPPIFLIDTLVNISTSIPVGKIWRYAGRCRQVFPTALGDSFVDDKTLFLGKRNLLFFLEILSDYTINYLPPSWFIDVSIPIYQYDGADTNDLANDLIRIESKIDAL